MGRPPHSSGNAAGRGHGRHHSRHFPCQATGDGSAPARIRSGGFADVPAQPGRRVVPASSRCGRSRPRCIGYGCGELDRSAHRALAWVADTARGQRRHTEFYFENNYVTFFYSSWAEMAQVLWRGRLIEAAGSRSVDPNEAPLQLAESCSPPQKPPHIILIHQESVVPPSLFPTLSYDPDLDTFFQSFDGNLNKLRVETFGGASWLSSRF